MTNYLMEGENLIGSNSMGGFFQYPLERNSLTFQENANVPTSDPIRKLTGTTGFGVEDFQIDSVVNEELGLHFISDIDEIYGGIDVLHSSNVSGNDISICSIKNMHQPLSPSDSGVGSPNERLPVTELDLCTTRSSEISDFIISFETSDASNSDESSLSLDEFLLNQPDLRLGNSINTSDEISGELDTLFKSTTSYPANVFKNVSSFDPATQPLSPSNTFDSGVGSPEMNLSALSPLSGSDQPLEIIDYSDLHDILSNDDTCLLSNSIILDNTFELMPSEKLLPNTVTTKLPSNDSDLLKKVEVHLPMPLRPAKPVLFDKPISSTEAPNSPPRSRCRKSKVTSLEEKKQRKRDQNKHAATRYREKKRQEAEEKAALYNSLNTRNKELNGEVIRISREINYLKDLMIEVYKIKGVIPKSQK